MGYRTRINKMSKEDYDKIKSLDIRTFYKKYDKDSDLDFDKASIEDIHMDTYVPVSAFSKELFEFGKYTSHEPPEGSLKRFFDDDELNGTYDNNDTVLMLANKDFLKYIIDSYREKIKTYYSDMITPFYKSRFEPSDFLKSQKEEFGIENTKYKFDFSLITESEQTAFKKIIDHINSFSREWVDDNFLPYNLDKGDEVTTSWKFEYIIFEMVRIYKEFDSENEVLIYIGS